VHENCGLRAESRRCRRGRAPFLHRKGHHQAAAPAATPRRRGRGCRASAGPLREGDAVCVAQFCSCSCTYIARWVSTDLLVCHPPLVGGPSAQQYTCRCWQDRKIAQHEQGEPELCAGTQRRQHRLPRNIIIYTYCVHGHNGFTRVEQHKPPPNVAHSKGANATSIRLLQGEDPARVDGRKRLAQSAKRRSAGVGNRPARPKDAKVLVGSSSSAVAGWLEGGLTT